MRIIATKPEAPGAIQLGRQGENGALSVRIDFSSWYARYGAGTFALYARRAGETARYAPTLMISGSTATWNVDAVDTALSGTGAVEMTYTVGETVVKSAQRSTVVDESMRSGSTAPVIPTPDIPASVITAWENDTGGNTVIHTTPEAPGTIPLGRQGEHLAFRVEIDFSEWAEEYGAGALAIIVRRANEANVYVAAITQDDETHTAVWPLTRTDTNNVGTGAVEMQYYTDAVTVKADPRGTVVDRALVGTVTDVDPSTPLIDQIAYLAAQAQMFADEAEDAKQAIEDMTVSAHTVTDGEPTVTKTAVGGVVNLDFGIPDVDKHYAYEQAQPSDTWTIQHNLRKYPSVSIVDTAGSAFLGEVHYIDENSLTISFAAAVAGYAYLN